MSKLGGYQVNITENQLEDTTKYANENDGDWSDEQRGQRVYGIQRTLRLMTLR